MNKRGVIAVLVGLVLIGGFAVRQYTTTKPELQAATVTKDQSRALVTIGNREFITEIAATSEEQQRGLSGRAAIGDSSGMLFPFSPPQTVQFWMRDMEFPLDIVWISDGKIIAISRDLPIPKPNTALSDLPTYSPPGPVDNVLEIKAGQGQTLNVGDSVTIQTTHAT